MNTTQAIREKINEIPCGQPFTNGSLLECGTRASVDQALSRLAQGNEIVRVARGVYVQPKWNELLGEMVMPSVEDVARTVVEADGATFQLHGAEAARRLGLSTQMQTRRVFLTDGTPRSFQMGKSTVVVKHVASKKIALSERLAGLAYVALLYLGKKNVNEAALSAIRKRLPEEEFEALLSARARMPGWLRESLHRYTSQESGH